MEKLNELKWNKVNSSQIGAVSFVHSEQALYIRFVKGPIWKYTPFTFVEYGELLNAESIGTHFHSKIKNSKTSIKISNGSKSK